MFVEWLSLTDYRNYRGTEVDLGPGVASFIGPNGQGKTNLVEAIAYISTLSSHRVASDAPLVFRNAPRAVIRTRVNREQRTNLIELEINPGRANRAQLNGSPMARPRELIGLLRTVVFAPEDVSLVKGDPAERRRFLDDLLVMRSPRMASVRADYERVIRQRNSLLKTLSGRGRSRTDENTESSLEVWNSHLINLGAQLMAARVSLIGELRTHASVSYDSVSDKAGPFELSYVSTVDDLQGETIQREAYEAALAEALVARRQAEIDRGMSLVGPHRDELAMSLRALPVKGYASHGESWSVALALRLASYELLRSDIGGGGEPVLILDDVFAELDQERRNRVAEMVVDAEQVLITAAVAQDVPLGLTGVRWSVANGKVGRG